MVKLVGWGDRYDENIDEKYNVVDETSCQTNEGRTLGDIRTTTTFEERVTFLVCDIKDIDPKTAEDQIFCNRMLLDNDIETLSVNTNMADYKFRRFSDGRFEKDPEIVKKNLRLTWII